MIQCQIATVTIESEGNVSQIEVPAYTREEADFRSTVNNHFDSYMRENIGGGHSIADFGMYLLAKAYFEPREQ
jgi:hypothetical protein